MHGLAKIGLAAMGWSGKGAFTFPSSPPFFPPAYIQESDV